MTIYFLSTPYTVCYTNSGELIALRYQEDQLLCKCFENIIFLCWLKVQLGEMFRGMGAILVLGEWGLPEESCNLS